MIAIIVATPQIADGRFFHISHSIMPENTGALPMVATVPIATPVRRIDEKKRPWKRAILAAAKIVHFHDQCRKLIFLKKL